jgi:hypothetical protein
MLFERINDESSERFVEKLHRFVHWWGYPEIAPFPFPLNPDPQHIPVALHFAMEWQKDWGPDFYGGSFDYTPSKSDQAGRVHCFDECGGLFAGYIEPTGTNPVLVFSDPEDFPPTTLNEFVVVAVLNAISLTGPQRPNNTIELSHQSSLLDVCNSENLLWEGHHSRNKTVCIWLDGDRLITRGHGEHVLVLHRPGLLTETAY